MVLTAARELADECGHTRISSQHLLFGLFALGTGIPFHILSQLGYSIDSLREMIAAEAPVSACTGDAEPRFDTSAAAALHRAESEAVARRHTYTGTEHMLLGLLSEEHGGAAHLFAMRGVDVEEVRRTIVAELDPVVN